MAKTTTKIEIVIHGHGTTTAEEVFIQARSYLQGELRRNGTSFSITSDSTESLQGE